MEREYAKLGKMCGSQILRLSVKKRNIQNPEKMYGKVNIQNPGKMYGKGICRISEKAEMKKQRGGGVRIEKRRKGRRYSKGRVDEVFRRRAEKIGGVAFLL